MAGWFPLCKMPGTQRMIRAGGEGNKNGTHTGFHL